jgi:hypothetical protein
MDLPTKIKIWLSSSPNECGNFYVLPKNHKIEIPGRPILPNCGTKTEILIYECIKICLPSYLRDTFHFLSMIRNLEIPDTAILATADIVSLYPNIPHNEGIDDT